MAILKTGQTIVKVCNVYVGGINLDSAPVTQNEKGWYYAKRNSAGSVIAYQTGKLVDFDTLTPWVDYKKYTNGSHADNFLRGDYDIDFSFNAGKLVTCDEDVEMEYRLTAGNTYCRVHLVKNPAIKMYFWHTDGFNSNKIVKAGQPICKIKNMSGSHLHFRAKGIYTRDLILGTNTMNFKKGDRVQFTGIQNIREGAGDRFSESRQSIVGELATIKDGPRSSQNKQFGKGENDSYTWWDMIFDKGGTGWVADVGKFKLFTDPVVPPEQTECEKELAILKTENEELKKALSLSEDRVKKLEDDIKGYKAEIEVCHDELRASSDRMTELENLTKDLTNKNAEIIKELAEWRGEATKKVLKETLEKIKGWFIKMWNR